MARSSPRRALLPLLVFAVAGCQDYNFNPVGHCLIQPGTERVTLSDISTADVLFVVDDSGSMGGEQEKLAANFASFVANLDQTNLDRRSVGLEPIDFHLAVTTTSIFQNAPAANTTCRSDCPGATSGSLVCCETSSTTGAPLQPMKVAKRCDATSQCGSGLECRTDCAGLLGENVCCDPTTKAAPLSEPVACATAGAECGNLSTHFQFDALCAPGNATDGGYYPHGAFVGFSDNPRVLHFDKELYGWDGASKSYVTTRATSLPPCSDGSAVCNRQGYTAAQLKAWFASKNTSGQWQGNVIAGTCGSGEEQALQAGKLAVQKAVAGQQVDTRSASGAAVASPAAWLHDNSKLVVVFVGDEDDCSNPQDASAGIILTGAAGADSCVADASLPADQRKQYAVADMVNYFAGLGRPMGAAFIVSTAQTACQDEACTAGQCCDYACTGGSTCRSAVCGGQGPGLRLLQASDAFRSKGADVVDGSMCDPSFGTILGRIADIVKPPSGLLLPTQPAGADIIVLRIANSSGDTRKTCRGPAPAGMTTADAKAAGYDWWFTAGKDQFTDAQQTPTVATKNIYINHGTLNCEANPGETYSADYLGQLPQGGCQTRSDCVRVLGGKVDSWTCYAGEGPTGFVQPTATAPGTCLCGNFGAGSY
jgi:hypothetical protein